MKKAVIVGAGSYVLGDSFGVGVLLPSLLELHKRKRIKAITLVVKSKRTPKFWSKVREIQETIHTEIEIEEFIIRAPNDLKRLDLSQSVAFIAVPDHFHYEYTAFFLSMKVPVWLVKPLTGKMKESLKLVELSRQNRTPLWVDYHKRFDPSNRKLKQLVANRQFGNLHLYSVQYSQPWKIPLEDLKAWSSDVNVFQYIGCHYVDQIFYIYPKARILRVSATGFEGSLKRRRGPQYDLISVIIDLEMDNRKKVRGCFEISWNDPSGSLAKSHQRVELIFESGRVIADQKTRGFQVWDEGKTKEENLYFFQLLDSLDGEGLSPYGYGFESIDRFLQLHDNEDAMKNERLPWGEFVYKTDLVLDMADKSLKKGGQWVSASAELLFE